MYKRREGKECIPNQMKKEGGDNYINAHREKKEKRGPGQVCNIAEKKKEGGGG